MIFFSIRKHNFTIYWLIALGIIFFDQITKTLVRSYMTAGTSIGWKNLSITHGSNTGVVFGFFQGTNWVFTLIAAIVIIFLCVYWKKLAQENNVAWALILGGATGNLIDRILFGAVTDFISIGWWPTFNIADSALVVGVVLLIWRARK
ncbi:MAG: signal peptidase II [Candidatus Woesearchaeota archaeon]|nr:signal peptidase II [Candidatus Woesearchaeota archaeon]